MSTLLKNAKIALPGAVRLESLDIEIGKGFIVNIGKNLHGENEIDLSGCEIFPGAVDPHVHFDEPGFTEREDFYHGSCAAASGGVTTVIDMPCTSVPPVINLANFKTKLNVVRDKSVIDFGFFGGVSAQCFESDFAQNMADIAEHVLGYKTYFISGMDTFGHLSFDRFFEVLKAAKQLKRPVLLHAEDLQIVTRLEKIEREKGRDWMNYYRSRPEEAEFIAVQNAIELAEKAGASLHIVHIGTAEAAELLQQTDLVTGETCPHYLQFSRDDLERIGGALKTAPVVKSPANRERLWELLIDGTIDFVTSDHAPAPASQKDTGSAWTDYSGIPGTGTLFPYLYSEGYVKRKMPLNRFLEIISAAAARRYGLFDRKGSIETGKHADFVIVNPDKNYIVKGAEFFSKGKITPFEEMTFQGKVVKTIIRGEVVYDFQKGVIAKPGFGKFLKSR